jgi:hypothetical protein
VKLGQGLAEESFQYLEKAKEYVNSDHSQTDTDVYRHYRKTLGRGHHRSADVAVAIGRHYNRIGDYETAM